MKKFSVIVLFILFSFGLCCQDLASQNWLKVKVNTICEFMIPNEMELRDDGSFISTLSDTYLKEIKYSGKKPSIIIQPKGMNEMSSESFRKYARIILIVQVGKAGEFYRCNEKFVFTANEKKELNQIFKTEVEQSLDKVGGKISFWYPFELIEINGLTTFKIAYEYTSTRGTVVVRAYKLYNYDMALEFVLSCRKSDEQYWQDKYANVINTFNFEKRKIN